MSKVIWVATFCEELMCNVEVNACSRFALVKEE